LRVKSQMGPTAPSCGRWANGLAVRMAVLFLVNQAAADRTFNHGGTLNTHHERQADRSSQGIDQVGDVLLEKGKVKHLGRVENRDADRVIDAAGLIVCPGLIDMHVHLREPGHEEEETISSGSAAAVVAALRR